MKDWYLMNTNHDAVSGFESDEFDSTASEAFEVAANSAIGVEVEICNYDLSQRRPTRVVVEGNAQDTKLNSLVRRMLAPIGSCKAGEYVYYKKRYWLIVGLVDDNGMYDKAVMTLCNYLLTWKNRKGDIIQRWVGVASASQYNNGETSDRYMSVRTDQIMIVMPDDDESLLIPHKQRFIIDMKCKIYEKNFADGVTVDTSNELITYELTRMDNVIFSYQDSGHSEFMAYQDEQHEKDGYYVINGKGYWLCEEPDADNDNETDVLSCKIKCDEPIIYNSLEPTIFTAYFSDSEGNATDIIPRWDINCDFIDSLNIEYVENAICISVDNKKLINKSFELSLNADGYEEAKINVMIKAFV